MGQFSSSIAPPPSRICSTPSVIDIKKLLQKPLHKLTNLELVVLCKHYKFESEKVKQALEKNAKFNGADYDKLCKMKTKEEIEVEKERLIDVVNKYVNDEGESKFFVYQVVIAKFEDERKLFFMKEDKSVSSNSESESEVHSNNPTTTSTFLKLCNNSTRPYVNSESSGVENENQEYDVQIPIESWRLSQAEFKGVELAKKKIRAYLKEFNTTPEKLGYSESLDLEAQRYVCEDRFMHFHFVRPTMKKNSRIVSNIPAVVSVKLLVSSLRKHELTKKAMATFADILNVNNYGVVHTGILIGEWKIEWNDNSLVRVECDSDQKLDANNTIAAIDIGEIAGADNVKKAFELITKISCNYNATKNYLSSTVWWF
ncbi:predicted protein, partial [Naegleria gruberi]